MTVSPWVYSLGRSRASHRCEEASEDRNAEEEAGSASWCQEVNNNNVSSLFRGPDMRQGTFEIAIKCLWASGEDMQLRARPGIKPAAAAEF